jgi:hypothetical protein
MFLSIFLDYTRRTRSELHTPPPPPLPTLCVSSLVYCLIKMSSVSPDFAKDKTRPMTFGSETVAFLTPTRLTWSFLRLNCAFAKAV